MLLLLARSAFLKQSAKPDCVRVFIRPRAAKGLAGRNRRRKTRKRRSGREVLTVWQRSFHIGRPLTIGRATAFVPAMAFCSTTKARAAGKLSSLAQSRGR